MSKTKPSQTQAASQSQSRVRTKEGLSERAASRPSVNAVDTIADIRVDSERPQALKMEVAVVTAGRSGERNITIEKFWVNIEGNLPCGFNVGTLPGNQLEVMMEQRSYRKTWGGTGSLRTGLAPIAPIGTKGRILVKDLTTGEQLEQPWTWHIIRGSFSLWQMIRRLIWKG